MQTTTATKLSAGTWTIDPATTTVTVTVKKFSLFTITSTLDVVEGQVVIDEHEQVTAVDVEVDAASYASPMAKRNEHVVGADFLDAEHHPTITMHAATVSPAGAGFSVTGELTIKGVTAPITLDVTDVTVDGTAAAFTATGTVDRTPFAISSAPGFFIGTDLAVTVTAHANAAV